jgi:osmotically-inducible protein OsmY
MEVDTDLEKEYGLRKRSGARAAFYVALVLILAAAGAYVYATNYNGLRDAVSTVREAVETEPGPDPEVERLTRRIADLELRSAVRDAFARHPELGGAALRVRVEDAAVTLAGTVPASGWKHAAERLAGEIEGVERIDNQITVQPPAADDGEGDRRLARKVEFELFSTEAFDLTTIEVTAGGDEIRLSGSVRSLAERLLAERVAGEVEGIGTVVNDLEVAAPPLPPNERRTSCDDDTGN